MMISTPESNALSKICREWYLSFGAITLAVVLSLWVHPLWMPLYELIIAASLLLLGQRRKAAATEPCGRLTLVTVYSLVITALISFAINVAYHTEFIHLFFDISTLNHSIPYITSLVIFPVCFVITVFLTNTRIYAIHVRNCHLHNVYNPDQPMYGRIIHGTYKSLMRRLWMFCLVISVIDWTYYLFFYKNFSLNTPDRFFYFVVPAAIYVWSIFHVRNSYTALAFFNGKVVYANSLPAEDVPKHLRDSVVVRYLVVRGKTLLLNVSEKTLANCAIDTPLISIFNKPFELSVDKATENFRQLTGLSDFKLKILYTSYDHVGHNDIYHVLVDVSEDVSPKDFSGQWVTLDGVDRLLHMGVTAPPFSDEIYRIYTITLAWKAYSRDGRRQFPIRRYRPNFRIEDLYNYDVDYNDTHWLKVSRINQDASFWFLKKWLL